MWLDLLNLSKDFAEDMNRKTVTNNICTIIFKLKLNIFINFNDKKK
jgi:hypothetical protein